MPTLNLGRVGFVNKGAYVGGTTNHKINDLVEYNGAIYACILAHNVQHLPTDNTYWQKWTGYMANAITNTPAGNIAALDVQSAINELDTEKQPISPNYTGTKSIDLASASTVNIGAATGEYIHITGTTTITAFDTVVAGVSRTLVFDGAVTITHNATSLILPSGANITTVAGDVARFVSEGSGNWRCVSYNSLAPIIHSSTAKGSTVDADELPITDSASSFSLKKITMATLKTFLGLTFLSKDGGTMTGAITALRETKVAMGANNIDLSAGNLFTKTISGATTLTVSNWLATGNANSFILELTNGGSAVITYPSGSKFAGGTTPTLTASGKDILGCYSHDGGTTLNWIVLGKDVK